MTVEEFSTAGISTAMRKVFALVEKEEEEKQEQGSRKRKKENENSDVGNKRQKRERGQRSIKAFFLASDR